MRSLVSLRRNVANARGNVPMVRVSGIVSEVAPALYRVAGLSRFVNLGETVTLRSETGAHVGEVIRIDDAAVTVKPFETNVTGGVGMLALRSDPLLLYPHASWKGRVLNALGQPLDAGDPLLCGDSGVPVDGRVLTPMRRERVTKAIRTGVRVVDAFTPLCAGQRIGIFAGSGVGKSTLLAMLARARGFDTVVLALVGERGREVREFLEDTLGESRANSVAIVSTGDESAAMRRMAPKTAMTIAEHFRELGSRCSSSWIR